MKLTIGTRQSPLALWQTQHVRTLLLSHFPDAIITVRHFITKGDQTIDKPLPEIGGKGLFTEALEEALFKREIDLAVHSLKDLPVENRDGLALGAIIGRADPRDVLIGCNNNQTIDTLPQGAVVGTSSLRRQSQLLIARPDLVVKSIRGNVETRINKVMKGEYDAVVLAKAGIDRLELGKHISETIPLDIMLPAPSQGALGVQCRADDTSTMQALHAIDCATVRICVTAERAFLHMLNAGCSAPVAAYAMMNSSDQLEMSTFVSTDNGIHRCTIREMGNDPTIVANAAASQVKSNVAFTTTTKWSLPH